MFFIFGWNRPKTTSYGPVQQHICPNCNNTKYWQLSKISRYFTLFFIPVFPHKTDYFYFCPVCKRGARLDQATFDRYKSIAEVNTAFNQKRITSEERVARLQAINPASEGNEPVSEVKYISEDK